MKHGIFSKSQLAQDSEPSVVSFRNIIDTYNIHFVNFNDFIILYNP